MNKSRLLQSVSKIARWISLRVLPILPVVYLLTYCLMRDQNEQGMPITALLGRGGIFMAVDLPSDSSNDLERLVILREPRGVLADRGPRITTLPNGIPAKRTSVWLSPQQWQPIDTLRLQWCESPPIFSAMKPDEPFYDVAIDCPSPFHGERLMIPLNELPQEIRDVIEVVPSPTQ